MSNPITLSAPVIYLREYPAPFTNDWQYSYDEGVTYQSINDRLPVYLSNPDSTGTQVMQVKMMSNLTVYSANYYFVFQNDNIVFDGLALNSQFGGRWSFQTTNIFGPPMWGAFQNGSSTTTGVNRITIQNVQIFNAGGYALQQNQGYLLQPYFGNGSNGCVVQNILVNSNSNLGGQNTAGIAGSYVGYLSQNFTLSNCINKGPLVGAGTCGILLNNAFNSASSVTVSNCINYSTISGLGACGLFGPGFGNGSSMVTVSGCTNYGQSDPSLAAANNFFGPNSFTNASNSTISTCYNFSDITVSNQGGIFGSECFNGCTGSITMSGCANFGRVGTNSTTGCAGIFGTGCFDSSSASQVVIETSYNTGDLMCVYSSGIIGTSSFNNCGALNLTVQKCYNSGSIGSEIQTQYNIAGIVGANSFRDWSTAVAGTITITNCYNDGPFRFCAYSAGIVGGNSFITSSVSAVAPVVSINNCYNSSLFNNSGQAGLLFTFLPNTSNASTVPVYINISNSYAVYNSDLYAPNALFYPYQQSSFNIYVYESACYFSKLWDSQLAQWSLLNVASAINTYNFFEGPFPYNLENYSWVDISVVTSIEPVSQNIPYKIPFVNNIFADTVDVTAGSVVYPNASPTFGVYSLIFSSTVFYQNIVLGTMNASNANISTDINLAGESQAFTLTYQDGAVQNTSITPAQTMQNTYALSFFLLNIEAFCLAGDSLVETPTGYRPIKEIRAGDTICTSEGERVVRFLFKTEIVQKAGSHRTKDRMYLVPAGTFPELWRDTLCSGGHPFLVPKYSNEVEKHHVQVWPNKDERTLKGYRRFLTFLNPAAQICSDLGLHAIYNVVIESNNERESFVIKVNGMLTETLSLHFYNISNKS